MRRIDYEQTLHLCYHRPVYRTHCQPWGTGQGWISPATADITHWNAAAETLIKKGFPTPAPYSDAALAALGNLRDSVLPVDSLLQKRIIALYEKRKELTQF